MKATDRLLRRARGIIPLCIHHLFMAMTELVPGIPVELVDGQPGLPGRDNLAFTEVLGLLRRLSDPVSVARDLVVLPSGAA